MTCSQQLGGSYITLFIKTLTNSVEPPDDDNVRTIFIFNKLRTSRPLTYFYQPIKRLFQFLLEGSNYIPLVLVTGRVVPNLTSRPGFHIMGESTYMTRGPYMTQWCERCHRIVSIHRDDYFGVPAPAHQFQS